MGTVWAARHELLGRDFALKFAVLPVNKGPEARARFLREAQIIGKLRHPNIVDVADFGEVSPDNTLYLAMELLTGESLASYIDRLGKLEPAEALAIALDIARGLTAAHAAGIVHHDIKPENIYLSESPTGGVVPKLLDFGISKRQDDETTRNVDGHPIGTPAYMSPEQALGELDVDHRTDLWSLGVVLHEMLSGKHPFVAQNYQALMTRIADDPSTPLDASVPEVVRVIVDRCLEKNPAVRYQSAEELVVALERTLAKLNKQASPLVLRGALALLFVLLLGFGLLVWMRRSPSFSPSDATPPPLSPAAAQASANPTPLPSSTAPPSAASAPLLLPTTATTHVLPAASTSKPVGSTGRRKTTSVNNPGF